MLTYEYELISNEGKDYHVLRILKDGNPWTTSSCVSKGDDVNEMLQLKIQVLGAVEGLDEDELTILLG